MENRISELEKTVTSLVVVIKELKDSISGGFTKSNNNFDKISEHFIKIEKELNLMNAKIDNLDGTTSKSLGKVNVKLDDLKTEISKINDVTGYDNMFDNLKIVK